jgi:predicted kinase
MKKKSEKIVFIVRGLPGAGKSTLSELIADVVISADDYAIDDKGNYKWNVSNSSDYHDQAREAFNKVVSQGVNRIAVANTNSTDSEFRYYCQVAKKYNYQVFTLIVENRHEGKSIHDVPSSVVLAMKKRFSIQL